MGFYTLQLELNIKNVLIFTVIADSKYIAVIVIEDTRRSGELFRDFEFLYPAYYSSEEEWDDFRNLIKATVFVLDDVYLGNEKLKESLMHIAVAMVEDKPSVNPKVDILYNKQVHNLFGESNQRRKEFIHGMLSFTETYGDYTGFVIGDEEHLTQTVEDEDGNVIS